MIDIEKIIQDKVTEALANVDFTKYATEIEKAVQEYFKSETFIEDFCLGMSEQGFGYSLGESMVPKIQKELKKLKVTQ